MARRENERARSAGPVKGGGAESLDSLMERLRESEGLRGELMNVLPGMAYRSRADGPGTMEFVSDGAAELTGHSPSEWIGPAESGSGRGPTLESLIHSGDRDAIQAKRTEAFSRKQHFRGQYRIETKDGAVKWVWDQAKGVYDGERLVAVAGFMTDVTDRKLLESELIQAQKMESVGRLAGGVAHDFNNLLTAILGYSELARGATGDERGLKQYLDHVTQAAQRANSLTQQLLSFARRQIVDPTILSIDELLIQLSPLLRRLLSENIELVVLAPGTVGNVRGDRNQIEQVLVNLVANGRDAMPQGGKLTVEAASVVLSPDEAAHHGTIEPGKYVRIRVSDTGVGIRPETQPFVFEPFFTTKGQGRGSGLGLATCFGIVSQHGGHISFRSEEGKGTSFDVWLPRVDEPAQSMTAPAGVAVRGGRETILVVEDEPLVRDLAVEGLRARGYSLLAAENGAHALELARQHFGPIDLLITDLVMPQMGGRELAELLERARPGMRVLYTSGYTESFEVPKTMLAIGGTFLRKPYTPTILAQKVREVLD